MSTNDPKHDPKHDDKSRGGEIKHPNPGPGEPGYPGYQEPKKDQPGHEQGQGQRPPNQPQR
jgi:hypothetical protein